MNVTATRLVDDHGTIVIFEGMDATGEIVYFASDHRPAQAIADAIDLGEEPICEVPDYMLMTDAETR